MTTSSPLTVSTILSATSEILTASSAGYQVADESDGARWPTDTTRVFEDPFTVVAVCVFESWSTLLSAWEDAQTTLVELISEHISADEAKAWDGYLVLLTPGSRGDDQDTLEAIRYDTTRVRKLVSSAPELSTVADVEHALLPLLPLASDVDLQDARLPLELLAADLSPKFTRPTIDALLDAFAEQRPLVEQLHKQQTETP